MAGKSLVPTKGGITQDVGGRERLEGRRETDHGYEVSFWGDGNILTLMW